MQKRGAAPHTAHLEQSRAHDTATKRFVAAARAGQGKRIWAHGIAGTYHLFAEAKRGKWLSLCGWYERPVGTLPDERGELSRCSECEKYVDKTPKSAT